MAYCKVYVDNKLCYEFPQNTTDLPRRIDLNCTDGVINGSVVKVFKNVTRSTFSRNFYAINFCEVQIWSCSDRYWGSGCDQVCGECRDDAPCDKVTGNCPARCVDGWHGEKCDKTCSVNCTGTCDQNTGNCHSCRYPGVLLPKCREGCSDGYWGSGCDQVCGECRDDAPCDKVTGNCPARCVDGWHGEKCDKPCSVSCTGTCDQNTGNCHGCRHPGVLLPLCDVFTGDDAATDGPSIPVIAGSAAGGVAVLVLVVVLLVFLIRRRSHRREPDNALVVNSPDAASVQPNHVYQNVQETDSRPIRSSDTSEDTAMPQDTTGDYEDVGNDASTYDKLEIYENNKDITNVYTDLKTVQ
ncbi:hypothetical protein BaRGS_00023631 [Batillaria attramentaria]|uniref:Uncharacterized protein n=1 Tax=Batillaria attramentaria TaxID=370345 RepID=A0ABD0KDL1_9CAEN